MEWFELASTYQPPNPDLLSAYDRFRMWADDYRFWVIFVYLVLVYYLGFATRFRMPILKTLLLYVLLAVGAIVFTFLDTTLPVKGALLAAVIILVIIRLRIKPNAQK
ncbi:YlaH-like family protein [Brevibacillus humidisoli]|uniref:YlaH-like family protein n=1 Tax=Brevibacillus humidisoli TaxID=2895522 RepID=UPI001E361D60|nr:YlaH-like family protein [Brevibacillus humidisoli]UFJ41880.1 YlaH-like family protein [Brevibacillus humidisoli]